MLSKMFWLEILEQQNDVFHEAYLSHVEDSSPNRFIVSSIIYWNVLCVTCEQQ